MNIVVLNGSPKGDLSITLQYIRYAAKKYPNDSFQYFPVAQNIRKLEKNEAAFREVTDAVKKADAVIWSFPLYFLLVCSSTSVLSNSFLKESRKMHFPVNMPSLCPHLFIFLITPRIITFAAFVTIWKCIMRAGIRRPCTI